VAGTHEQGREVNSMFVVLDTNHYREILHQGPLGGGRLQQRLIESGADVFTTNITVQEITQGWLAEINRKKPGRDQHRAYQQFYNAIADFALLTILACDDEAVTEFHKLQSLQLRVGSMDLKIAAICISHQALLLTRNLVDFERIPGLHVANWMD
jgi:tRNA(fMet)-specific endonuclease VapC